MGEFPRFEALPEEKRNRILEACLDEFSERGYQNASTNRIVKAAGISKGLLFHYFDNKKKLFLYVLDHSIMRMMALMEKHTASVSGDIFEMLGQYAQIKLWVALEEPRMYRILYDVYVNFPEDVKKESLEKYGKLFADYRTRLAVTMDTSRLKEGVDAATVANLVTDFLDGYYQRRLAHFKTLTPEQLLLEMDDLNADVMKHLGIIRQGVYKQ